MAATSDSILLQFRGMLATLDQMLRGDELEKMKYMCRDFGVGAKLRERIKTGIQLFEALEERKKLAPNDLETLKKLLELSCGGRKDIFEIIGNFERTYPGDQREENNGSQNAKTELNQACIFLETNLGREYLMVLRRCGISDSVLDQLQDQYPRNVQEVIHQAFKAWQGSNNVLSAKETLIKALRSERRNDLANKVERNDFS